MPFRASANRLAVTLISEQDDAAIVARVVAGAKLGEAEPLRIYFGHLKRGGTPIAPMAPGEDQGQAQMEG